MKSIADGFGYLPFVFASFFAFLLVRARLAFGDWPRLSGNDPWALVNRAPRDTLHGLLSYSTHIDLIYFLLVPAAIGILLLPLSTRARWVKWVGGVFAVALLFFQSGRFLYWFLD